MYEERDNIARALAEATSVQGWTSANVPGVGWMEISAVPLELVRELSYIPCVVIYRGKEFSGTHEEVANQLMDYAFSKIEA